LSFGWDLKFLEKQKRLKVIFTSPDIFLRDLKSGKFLTKLVSEMNLRRAMIDTVSYLQMLTEETFKLRKLFTQVLYGLEKEGITSIVTEESDENGTEVNKGTQGFAYAADAVISLRFVEDEGSIKKAILVLKTRGSAHDAKIREFEVTGKGIDIKNKFEKVEGILSGNTRKVFSERMENFFVKKLK